MVHRSKASPRRCLSKIIKNKLHELNISNKGLSREETLAIKAHVEKQIMSTGTFQDPG
jgi:hypothetical protein